MYKILIADDESIVIDALTFIIEKNFPGQCVIESAGTGRKVIEQAEYFRPDIVFMDIQMPGINGIEAMKEIRRTNENILFIVVSAFVKFDYAKDAIDIGVLEYINKPINKEQIKEALTKAMAKVDELKHKRSEDLANREKLEIVTPIIENGFIYSLVYQTHSEEELNNFLTLLGITEHQGCLMALQFGEPHNREKMENAIGTSVRLQKEYTRIKDTIKNFFFDCCVGAMMGNMILVFLPMSKPEQEEEYDLRIRNIETARKMVRELGKNFDARFRAGIGAIHELEELSLSYNEALRALSYNSSDSVVHFNDLPMGRNYEEDYPMDIEKGLYKSVEEGDVNRALYYADAFFDWMMSMHVQNVTDRKLKILELVLWTERIGVECGGITYRFDMRSTYLDEIMRADLPEQQREWMNAKISAVCHGIMTRREDNSEDMILKAQNYIEQNYGKDLILDDVSKELQISPYYFSKLFKKRTGSTFIEYLTTVRMDHAKALLRNTNKSMKEICFDVGYTDANYFSRIFKKHVGVTPSDYKEGKDA